MSRLSLLRATGVTFLLAASLVGCDALPYPTPPAAPAAPPRLQSGADKGTEPFDPRKLVQGPSFREGYLEVAAAFRAAYERQGRPRILVLVNRDLEIAPPNADTLLAIAKMRRTLQVEGPAKVAPPLLPTEGATLNDEVTLYVPGVEAPPVSPRARDLASRTLEAQFTSPFIRDARCDVVQPEWAWRNSREEVARLGQQGTAEAKAAADLLALSKCADVAIAVKVGCRVLSDRGTRTVHEVTMAAEALNLHTARLLATEAPTLVARQPASLALDSAIRLQREELEGASLLLARDLMRSIMAGWESAPEVICIRIHDLVSDTQLRKIVAYLEKLQGAKKVDPVLCDVAPQGGYAEIRMEFTGQARDLGTLLESPTALPGFRLETIHKAYSIFSLKIVTK